MSEFIAITTQEEFDAAIKARLDRERAKYADYDGMKSKLEQYEKQLAASAKDLEAANKAAAAHTETISKLEAEVHSHTLGAAKVRAALAAGLPYEMAERLTGDDDEALKADAAALMSLMGSRNKPAPAPLASSEPSGVSRTTSNNDAAFKSLLTNLKEE